MKDFDIVYPPKDRIKFSGGQNSKYEDQYISDNESADCLNVVLGADSVETRGGSTKLNTNTVGSYVGQGLYTRHDNDNSQTMCAWFGGNLYTLGVSTFTTVPSAQSVYTANTRVTAAEYENYIFFGQSGSQPYKYNGAEFTRHGVDAPTSTMTVASQATGSLTGHYQYLVTYVNSNLVQGDVSPVTASITAASATLRITSIPVAPQSFGVASRKLYRTEASGTTYKLLTTISDNTTTTYDDNTADASLGATAPTDQGIPPNYSVIRYHQNRLFVNDPTNQNYIVYSELAEPYTFKATNFIRVGDNTTDLVRGIEVYSDGILALCDNSLWMIYMPDTDPSNWLSIKLKSSYGSKSPYGSFSYNNKLMFPAIQNNKIAGFAALSGQSVETSATILTVQAMGSDLKSNPIEDQMFNIQSGYVHNISSFVYQNKAYISVTYGAGTTTNNRIFVFDFSIGDLLKRQEGAWIPWTGINAAQFCEYSGNLYCATSTATGYVYRMLSSTYSDDGTAINSYYQTKEFSGYSGHEVWTKDFRKIGLLYEKSGAWYMNITHKVNAETGVGTTQQISLNPGSSLWGTMRWGIDTWGGGESIGEQEISLGQVRGKRIQFKFSNQNTANQKFKVLGLKFNYNLKGKR